MIPQHPYSLTSMKKKYLIHDIFGVTKVFKVMPLPEQVLLTAMIFDYTRMMIAYCKKLSVMRMEISTVS